MRTEELEEVIKKEVEEFCKKCSCCPDGSWNINCMARRGYEAFCEDREEER